MADVTETLQQLIRRRLRELGDARGRDEPLTLAEAYRHVPNPEVTYELVRRAETGQHSNIGEPGVRTIATMLDVDANVVRAARGQRPALGPFALPPRADRLKKDERAVVVAVVDAILNAAEQQQPALRAADTPPAAPSRRQQRRAPRHGSAGT